LHEARQSNKQTEKMLNGFISNFSFLRPNGPELSCGDEVPQRR
jgi:hypothetical protein